MRFPANHLVSDSAKFDSRFSVSRRTGQPSTSRLEHLLLWGTVFLLPLQEHIPTIAGFSIAFLLFAAQAVYILAKRSHCLSKIWLHSLFRALYIFLCLGFVMELFHPNASYGELFRTGQSFSGAVFIATVCRDERGLRSAMYGYVAAGAFMSFLLFLTSYGALSSATAVDYGEGDKIRGQVFAESPLEANLNGMAFVSAQGTGVALALALAEHSPWARGLFLGLALICFVATFLPMSRSGIATVLVICGSIIFSHGVNRAKSVMVAGLIGASMAIWVPDAVWSRFSFSMEEDRFGRMEGRAAVYTAALEHLPEYVMTGVGAGNYWGAWGSQSQFGGSRGRAVGAHNVFLQATIYWGVLALLGLIAIVRQAYSCLPTKDGNDGLALSLHAIALSLLLLSLVVHNLYAKEFSLGFGLIAGAHHWLWSKRNVLPRLQRRKAIRVAPEIGSPPDYRNLRF